MVSGAGVAVWLWLPLCFTMTEALEQCGSCILDQFCCPKGTNDCEFYPYANDQVPIVLTMTSIFLVGVTFFFCMCVYGNGYKA